MNHYSFGHRSNQRGSAILLALGFMVIAMVLALGVHTLVGAQLRASGALRERVAAEYLAQGGIARTIAWINSQGYQMPQASTLTAAVPVKRTSNNAALVLPSNHPDGYTDTLGQAKTGVVTSYNSFLTSQSVSGGTYSVVASLISMQPETWELLATGQLGATQRHVGAILFRQPTSLFSNALFGKTGVTLSGSAFTDSYDSSLGAYGGTNKFQTGSVASNVDIFVSGSAAIKGDAIPGPSRSVDVSGGGSVTGLTDPASSTRTLPAVTIPGTAVNLGAITLSGVATQTLTAGTYQATSLSITNGAQLIIDASGGPVNLYVTGIISVAGAGVANATGKPQNLFIAQVGGANATFSNGAAFYGTVYAPDSALSVPGNADFYGAFIGNSVAISNSGKVHYDRLLATGVSGAIKLISQWTVQS